MFRKLYETPIAIIGMASVFPQAHNLREFWDNIVNKVNCIEDIPASRWNIDDYYDPDPAVPDKTYSKRGGFLPEIDFDPMEFGLPPNILEVTDVSQMLGLVVARDAMIDAGYLDSAAEIRDRTGVILGVGGGQKLITPLTSRLQYPVWRRALESSGITGDDADRIIEKMQAAYIKWEENSFPGMLGNVIAGRIANRLDLGGTNCVVDAACASSMAAMKLAISDLIEGRADMMITGGVDTDNSPFMYMCFSKTPAFSPGDVPRPFDEESDGMLVGEGVGMIVLKRLEDAERDGDRIYAVIRGIGTSSDGRFKSIYAPRGEGQERALLRAYEDAGISPSQVQLLEAHGTGTKAGDLTEATTVVRFFKQHIDHTEADKYMSIALGSVKSQIGHAKAAAGAAGVIKTALALHHKVLPATLNVDQPNPKLGLDESPVYVNSQTRPWITNGEPRRAGVSSFGFGGTNYHFVMEEYNPDHTGQYRIHSTAETVVFHDETPQTLINKMRKVLGKLQNEDTEEQYLNLSKYSRVTNIPAADARVGFVSDSPQQAMEMLEAAIKFLEMRKDDEEWLHPKGIFYRRRAMDLSGKVVALFSGQGSQYVEMGRELAINFATIRESYSKIDTLFKQDNLPLVSNAVFPPPAFTKEEKAHQDEMITRTDYVQPAIGAFSAGLYNLFKSAGFQPDFAAGHSFGELTALWAAGSLDDADYYRLVKARGLAMAPPADPDFDAGTMMAVTGDVSNLAADVAGLEGVHMANINSPKQVVLAGKEHNLLQAKSVLEGKGYNVIPIAVAAAFHTPLVGHAQKPFAEAVSQATFRKPKMPVYSNATGKAYPTTPAAMGKTLSEHILNSVNFHKEIENIYDAGGRVFIEFGPRNVLTNLVRDILGDKEHVTVALNPSRQKDSDRQFREALARLRVMGLELAEVDRHDFDPIKPASAGRRKGMQVKISGGMYTSERHQKEYQAKLNDGFKIKTGGEVIVKEVIKEVPVEVVKEVPVAVQAAPQIQSQTSLEDALATFSQQQSEILKTHQQYLSNQGEYIKVFTQLATQQQQVLSNGSLASDARAALEKSMDAFHAHQAETLRVHETYLQRQSEQTQSLLQVLRGGAVPSTPVAAAPVVAAPQPPVMATPVPVAAAPAPVAATPAPVPAAQPASSSGLSVSALSESLLGIVSEKTGYPSEMLELGMDMEADLGIDSIKRVEILGAMRDQFPELPQLKAEDLAELRTLQEIVDYMGTHVPANGASSPAASAPQAPVAAAAVSTPAPVAAVPAASSGLSVSALSESLLGIVSEKTGYPSEMLELGMDMEADLGIDSIKRVEILGAMRDQFPELPQLKAEDLAELRTLQEIVDYMGTHVPANGASSPAVSAPQAPAPVSTPAPVAAAPAPATSSGLSVSALSESLLGIVSEKTGYPAEMLELGMDMEADLGIDSIKRVEILGAMRDQFPELPQLKAEDLAELRTLQEIVDYMGNYSDPTPPTNGGVAAPAPQVVEESTPVAAASNGLSVDALSGSLLDIVSEKTGYPAEMLELSMDMEADLGIDSIKRVEILGAMRDQFPELPQLKAEDLAELRTLQEIVDYMGNYSDPTPPTNGGVAAPAPQVVEESTPVASTPVPAASSGLSVDALSGSLLDIVSEKTGYPSEMLELSMDMEADLGIDSIKRVEILGAMRDQFPALPQLKAEDLAELRTLQEIVDYMGGFQLNGHAAPKAEASVLNGQPALTQIEHDIPRSPAMLKYLPMPDEVEISLSAGSVCLITDDGTSLTAQTAQKLAANGWNVAVLSVPGINSQLPANIKRYALPDTTEASLQATLAQVGDVAVFVHINPPSQGGLFNERDKSLIKLAFLVAKHLKKQLTEGVGFRAFFTVARLDGTFGTTWGDYGAIPGGLFGLAKTLNLEWATVFCRGVDLAIDMPDALAADYLVGELHDPNRLYAEVGYTNEARYTLTAPEAAATV